MLANAAWHAVERVGLPECQLNLSQAVCYLATAPKSNACTVAIGTATKDVKEGRTLPVPKHLRDSHYHGAKEQFGHGVGYKYAHDFEGGWVDQEYIPADVGVLRPDRPRLRGEDQGAAGGTAEAEGERGASAP